ncbi:MAG: polyprenyl synthetase family protein [Nevskia sp.]|nr:polyprenyl synthetase family protein [Nevskia sp.]
MNLHSSEFAGRMPAYVDRLQHALDQRLPAAAEDPARLHQAMRYACDGGKRLRALLVYAAGESLGAAVGKLDAAACAVELIHAYSLVHDDLPAMDDDDLRRGRPTVHKAYDEATAILVGDGLQTLAFAVLADEPSLDVGQRLRMVSILARASGSLGMVGGQAVDIASEGRLIALEELQSLHARKTGALILASLQLAAVAANATPAAQQALESYGRDIGLAFQIQDDVLDETASTEALGKTAGKDLRQQKSTYPALLGLDGARRRAAELFEQARSAVAALPGGGAPLRWLADFIEGRGH